MKQKEAINILDKAKASFGTLLPDQVEFFLSNNLPKHFSAKRRLDTGASDWQDLRLLSAFLKYYDDHAMYENYIRSIDPKIDIPVFLSREFTGSGWGHNSLNSYRKVVDSHRANYFEKVYLIDSPDYEKIKFFYGKVHNFIKNIKVPTAFFVEGEKLALAYYEWLDFKPLSTSMLRNYYFNLKRCFEALPVFVFPDVFMDFISEPMFKDGFRKAELFFDDSQDAFFLANIRDFLSRSAERCFVHGDLIVENCSESALIDFDKCGYYPKGYDVAYLASKSMLFSTTEEMVRFFSVEDHELISFLFFSFIFYCRKIGVKAEDAFLFDIWGRLIHEFKKL